MTLPLYPSISIVHTKRNERERKKYSQNKSCRGFSSAPVEVADEIWGPGFGGEPKIWGP